MAEAEEITCITTNAYSLDADEYVTELYKLAFLGKFRLKGLNLLIEGIFSILQWCKATLCFFYSLVQGAQHQSSSDLSRKLNDPWSQLFPTVGTRLVIALDELLQHAGQVGYIRGLLHGKGWQEF